MAQPIADLVARLRLDNSDLNRNAKSAERALTNLKRTAVAALAGWVSVRGATAFWGTLIDSVEEYKMSVIQTAAFTTGMMKKQPGASIADQYKEAKGYAEDLVYQLELLDAKTILTGNDLKLMNRELLKQGILLDTNNQKQLEGFTTIANAVAAISAGSPNKQIQLMQETRALLQGQVRMNDQLAMMLDAQTGDLKEQVKLHKEQGDIVEWLGTQLSGFNTATKDIEHTWAAIGTNIQTVSRHIIRGGLTEAYQDILGTMNDMYIWAIEHKDQISSGLAGAWQSVKTIVVSLKEIYSGINESIKNITDSLGLNRDVLNDIKNVWKWSYSIGIPTVSVGISGMAKLLSSYLIATKNMITSIAKNIGTLFDNYIGRHIRKYIELSVKLTEKLEEYQSNIIDAAGPFVGALLNPLKELSSDAIEKIRELGKAYKENFVDDSIIAKVFKDVKFTPDYTFTNWIKDVSMALKEGQKKYENFGQITKQGTTRATRPDIGSVTTSEERKELQKSLLNIAKQKEAYASLIGDVKGMYVAKGDVLKQQLANELADTKKTEEEKYWITKRYIEEINSINAKAHQSWFYGFKNGLRDYQLAVTDNVRNVSDLVTNSFSGMEDALVRMTQNGKFEFRELADSIIADLARIAIRTQITGPLASALSSAMGIGFAGTGTGSYTSPDGSYTSTFATYKHNGGIVGDGGVKRSVPIGIFSSAPRLHDGLMSDEFPAILQRGEEVVSKSDVKSRGAGQGVVINVQEAPGTKAKVEQRGDGSLDIIIERVESMLAAGINRGNSPLARSIEGQYGVNRAFGARR